MHFFYFAPASSYVSPLEVSLCTEIIGARPLGTVQQCNVLSDGIRKIESRALLPCVVLPRGFL